MAYQLEIDGSEASTPLRQDDGDRSIGRWLRRLVDRQSTGILPGRLSGGRTAADVAELQPYLLRDIGLPYDFCPRDGLVPPH